jgi:hypothetical protein
LILKKVMSIVFICESDTRAFFEPFTTLKNIGLFHNFSPISLGQHRTSVTCIFFSNFTQHLKMIRCSKSEHSFLRRDVETHTSSQRHNFHKTDVSAFRSYATQVETCTDTFSLRLNRMASLQWRNKIIPGT